MPFVAPNEPDLGNITGYIKDLVESGLSNNQSYQAFLGDGGHIQESTFNRLYGYVSDSVARQESWASLDPYQIPDENQYGTVAMGQGGGYYGTVEVLVQDRQTGLVQSMWQGYSSADPFTPAEAGANALANFQGAIGATGTGVRALGFGQVNMYKTVPWKAA